jgi:hypothetical protein
MRYIRLILLFIVTTFPVVGQDSVTVSSYHYSIDSILIRPSFSSVLNLMDRKCIIKGLGADTVYTLPDQYILSGTESIMINGILLNQTTDYSINYRFGELHFQTVIDPSVEIIVKYRIMPFGFKQGYAHRMLQNVRLYQDSTHDTTIIKSVRTEYGKYPNIFESSQIQGSGSITRGFTIGSNQDFTLNSGPQYTDCWEHNRGCDD